MIQHYKFTLRTAYMDSGLEHLVGSRADFDGRRPLFTESTVSSHVTSWSWRTNDPLNRHFLGTKRLHTYMKNVPRDSPWNLILHILLISAQTGSEILKTAFDWTRKFDFMLHDLLLKAINPVFMRDPITWQVRKINTLGPTGPARNVGG